MHLFEKFTGAGQFRLDRLREIASDDRHGASRGAGRK
jgi:hypothetical protein